MEKSRNLYLLKYKFVCFVLIYWNLDYIFLLKYKLLNCFFPSVRRNIVESLYKSGVHWPKQKDIKEIIMFIKVMLIKEDIQNIFNILNTIIMHIFLLFIDIVFVILSIEVKTLIL